MNSTLRLLFLLFIAITALKTNAQTNNYGNGNFTPTTSSEKEEAERNRKNILNSLKNNDNSSSTREKSSLANNNIIRTPEVKVNQYYTTLESEGLMPFKDAFSEKYGYVDKSKRVIIKAGFEEVSYFKNGNARVALRENGVKKYGYIDAKGSIVVPCIYTTADQELTEVTIVSNAIGYGVIKESGEKIIPCIYEDIKRNFLDLFLVKKNGLFGVINNDGKLVIPIVYTERFRFGVDGVAKLHTKDGDGFIDFRGNLLVPCKYFIKAEYLTDFTIIQDADNKYGVVDPTGAFIIPLGMYDEIDPILSGFASVKKLNKWGAVDNVGKLIIPTTYLQKLEIFEGKIKVKSEKGEGFLNSAGKEIIASNYIIKDSKLTDFTIIQDEYKNYGVVDEKGAFIIPLKLYEEIKPLSNGVACVKLQGKWGAINRNGKLIIPAVYYYPFSFYYNYAKVRLSEKGGDGFIDNNGAVYIPLKYRIKSIALENFMIVINSLKMVAVMDKSGKLIIPFGIYDKIEPLQDRLASVKKQEKWGAVNSLGELVVPTIYTKELTLYGGKTEINLDNGNKVTIDMDGNWVAYNDSPIEFNEGVGKVYDHNYGFIDSVGNIIVPCIYHSANNFHDGMAAVASDMYHWGFVNMKGEVVVPLKYERVTDFKNGEARLYKEQYSSEFSYVDKNGKTYRKSKVK